MSKKQFEQMRKQENTQWDNHDDFDRKPLSFEIDLPNELFGIEPVKAKEMVSGLDSVFAERQVLKDAYLDVIQLDINSENLPTFKELRLKFVKIRTSINSWHKANKAFYLAGGRFVDAIKNKEIAETEEIEAKLMEAEKFFENQEKQKAKDLNDTRIAKILPWVENAENMDFKEFSDEDFDDFVFGKKVKFEQRIAEEKSEAERVEKERLAELERKKAIEAENAKLKAEAESREAELQAKKEAEIKAENDRIAKIEAEEKVKKELAKAPIKEQLNAWVDSFVLPADLIDNELSRDIIKKFNAYKTWSKSEIEKL